MVNDLPRRSFLKLLGLTSSSLAFKPPPPDSIYQPVGLVRVANDRVNLFAEPSFKARQVTSFERDTLISVLSREIADDGPKHNPLWYQIPDGYAHSGNLQWVEWKLQRPRRVIPAGGALFEVSVPYTRTYRMPDPSSSPVYRLYYQSTAWVEDVVEGLDGRKWYRLWDDLLNVRYYARAEHLRRVFQEELTPISPEVALKEKRIEVHLAQQELIAYEKELVVLRTRISSGIPDTRPRSNGIPTATPSGRFNINIKMPVRHMGDGRLTSNLAAYELPGVPWVSYFHSTGVAFHGTYWHTDYGRPRSHGCVNMRPEEAKWLFRWSMPVVESDVRFQAGYGTKVVVL